MQKGPLCCTAQAEGVAAGTRPLQLALHSSSFSNDGCKPFYSWNSQTTLCSDPVAFSPPLSVVS